MIRVILTPAELLVAATVGVARHIQALKERRPDRHGARCDDGWSLHIEGAAGEMAAARAMGRYWDAPVGTYRVGGDIGELQVRTRSDPSYELLIRPNDRDSDVFVLVTGRAPYFTVHGWITGADAKQAQWVKTHGGRPPAYFVPHAALRPLGEAPAGYAG